uniref:Uncharacterized protein n=1 Tax=Anguilla anguilla TaxID=7936 RepID=A0A0E9S028_ANGAN
MYYTENNHNKSGAARLLPVQVWEWLYHRALRHT